MNCVTVDICDTLLQVRFWQLINSSLFQEQISPHVPILKFHTLLYTLKVSSPSIHHKNSIIYTLDGLHDYKAPWFSNKNQFLDHVTSFSATYLHIKILAHGNWKTRQVISSCIIYLSVKFFIPVYRITTTHNLKVRYPRIPKPVHVALRGKSCYVFQTSQIHL